MIKETFDSIKMALNERVSSPFLGTFSICWLIINWKIPVFIFKSDLPIEQTIAHIEQDSTIFNRLLYPFIMAAILLAVYPWISYVVFRYFNLIETKKRISKHKTDFKILRNKASLVQAEADLEVEKAISLLRIDERKRQLQQETDNQERNEIYGREKAKINIEYALLEERLKAESRLRNMYPKIEFPNPVIAKQVEKQTQ